MTALSVDGRDLGTEAPVGTGLAARPSSPPPPRIQRRLAALLAVALVGADQGTKTLAWRRHWSGVTLNPGGDSLVPAWVGGLVADPLAGAALDLVGAMLLALACALVFRRARRWPVWLGCTLLLAGCASDLGDRLGLVWLTGGPTVPQRGVIDWLTAFGGDGQPGYNLADVYIALGTVVLIATAAIACLRRYVTRPRVRRVALIGGVILIAAVAYSGVGAWHRQPPGPVDPGTTVRVVAVVTCPDGQHAEAQIIATGVPPGWTGNVRDAAMPAPYPLGDHGLSGLPLTRWPGQDTQGTASMQTDIYVRSTGTLISVDGPGVRRHAVVWPDCDSTTAEMTELTQ